MLEELLKRNRSYRAYDESVRVSEAELKHLVDLTRFIASGKNRQPLKYHISFERAETETLLSMTKWAAALPELALPRPGEHPAAFIVILQDLSVNPKLGAADKDVGIAAQTILLGAAEQGLGGLMIGNFRRQEVKEFLKPGEKLEPVLLIALGKPSEQICLTAVPESGKTDYYRENGVHYVPKRALEDILV